MPHGFFLSLFFFFIFLFTEKYGYLSQAWKCYSCVTVNDWLFPGNIFHSLGGKRLYTIFWEQTDGEQIIY